VDYCFKFMYIYNQVSLGAGKIFLVNAHLKCHCVLLGSLFYHVDHGTFSSRDFKDDCHIKVHQFFKSLSNKFATLKAATDAFVNHLTN